MSDLILHGGPRSNYVRTCRIALAEKGVAYTHDPAMPQSPEQLERHPWGKIPAMRHGDVRLYETLAITRYIDESFDGPALQPAEPAGRAQMSQWISVYNAYVDPPVLRAIVIQRLLRDPSDEGMIEAAVPQAAKALEVMNDALGRSAFFVGDSVSLADCFHIPAMDYLAKTPEGQALLADAPNVTAWMERMMARDGVQAVLAV